MANPFAHAAARALRSAAARSDSRTGLIRAVRAAARRLGIEDDDRRQLQQELTGKASMTDMTPAELGKLLDHLNRDRPAPMGHRAHVGKIRALWWSLYWLGLVDSPNASALDAFVARQAGVTALRFLDHGKAPAVIEAMKAWLARDAHVRWPTEADVASIAAIEPGFTLQRMERHAVLSALHGRLREEREIMGGVSYAQVALGLSLNQWSWTERELDEAIKLLGKKLRRAIERKRAAE